MKDKKPILMLLTALAVASSLSHAADNAAVMKAMQTCSICHGIDGNSTSPAFPRLAGQQAPYLEAQLKAFRDHTRADQDAQDYMWGWAAPLNDQTIKELATYYAAQKPLPGKQTDPATMERGKRIYEGGIPSQNIPACAACHGQNAQGNKNFPRLAGQHASYLIKQLKVFHSQERPAAIAMHEIVKTLTPEEMEAVAAYLQSK